jgi:tetratricopeptide (TPR) repeat protein
MARQCSWDWSGAEKEYRRALALNPDCVSARQWYGVFLAFRGRYDEALNQIHRARELDPVSLSIGSQAGLVLLFARRYAEAATHLLQVLELDASNVEAKFYLAIVRILEGRPIEGAALCEDLPTDNPDFQAMLAYAYATSGRERDAKAIVEALEAMTERYVPPFWLAVAHLGLEDHDRALEALDEAWGNPDDSIVGINVFPMFDPLRDDVRFGRILRKIGLN